MMAMCTCNRNISMLPAACLFRVPVRPSSRAGFASASPQRHTISSTRAVGTMQFGLGLLLLTLGTRLVSATRSALIAAWRRRAPGMGLARGRGESRGRNGRRGLIVLAAILADILPQENPAQCPSV